MMMNEDRMMNAMPQQADLPRIGVGQGVDIAYRVDDCRDGWMQTDTVVMLHGIAENGDAFKAWVPHFARRFRVIRPDLRGYGQSSGVTEHEPLSIPQLADDIQRLIEQLQIEQLQPGRVHLIGTKLGAQVALELAQRRPAWLASMTLAGVLASPGDALGAWVQQWIDLVDREGVEGWARATMPGRMGGSLPPQAMEWWTRYMGGAPASTVKACFRMLPGLKEPARLEQIQCPTAVIVAVQPGQASEFDQKQSVASVARWVGRIPDSTLVELAADSYHVGASHPDQCAQIALAFIDRHAQTHASVAAP